MALVITVVINVAIVFRYIDLEKQGLNWWSAIILRDIVIYFLVFLQMIWEYFIWHKKLFKWREELVKRQRFSMAGDDQSENFINKNIQSIVESIVADGDDGVKDQAKLDELLPIDKEVSVSLKVKKVMPLDSTIYSCTYVSLIKSNKKKYRLTQTD